MHKGNKKGLFTLHKTDSTAFSTPEGPKRVTRKQLKEDISGNDFIVDGTNVVRIRTVKTLLNLGWT